MSVETDIAFKLKEALILSCDEAFYFSDDETHLIDAEYLLTVNVAKKIKELNTGLGFPYKIRLEHCTKLFATACTPLFGEVPADNFLGYESIVRCSNDTERSGEIDVAVYEESNGINVPVCAVEVKGFNPAKKGIQQDLKRNAEYFGLISPTGKSILRFTFFVALHNYKCVWSDEKEKRNLDKVKKRYSEYIVECNFPCNVKHQIEVMTIRRGVISDSRLEAIQEFGLQGDEDYHFVGVVVTVKNALN